MSCLTLNVLNYIGDIMKILQIVLIVALLVFIGYEVACIVRDVKKRQLEKKKKSKKGDSQ